jgi:hypothetical protein
MEGWNMKVKEEIEKISIRAYITRPFRETYKLDPKYNTLLASNI